MLRSTIKDNLPGVAKLYRTLAACLLFPGIFWIGQASVKADTITFESDPIGIFPNGSQSVHSNLVRFSASGGGTLIIIEDFGVNQVLGTRGLAVFGSNADLIIEFAVPVTSLSLWFGNDDLSSTVPGDTAILQVSFEDEFVDEIFVLLNRDDIMNQQISFSGATITRARFRFSQDLFLAETVDNIEFTPIPEPTTVALLGIGIVGVVARIRRRNPR